MKLHEKVRTKSISMPSGHWNAWKISSSFFYWSFMKSQEENQSQKKMLDRSLCISMPKLWFNIYYLHSYCFWLFMKLQQNLFLTFHEASAKKWKKSFYSIFEFLPQYWPLYDMEEPKSESLKAFKLKIAIIFKLPWILLHNMKQKFPLQSLSSWLLFWYFGCVFH